MASQNRQNGELRPIWRRLNGNKNLYTCRVESSRFSIRLTPLEDELLSSWLVRTAYAHRIDAATFVNLHLPKWKNLLWTRDIDISASADFLLRLSFKSGLSIESLLGLTLRAYEGYLSEKIHPSTRNNLIQPLGNYSRIKIGHGLRFCPKCLAGDAVPYFRKKWRLSFSTACIYHDCFLLDCCPKCGASVNLYRSYFDQKLEFCYRCGFDLKMAAVKPIDRDSSGIGAIRTLYDVLDTGIYRYGALYMYSLSFFEVLPHLCRLMVWHRGRVLKLGVSRLDAKEIRRNTKTRYLMEFSLHLQHQLFSVAMELLRDLPKSLVSAFLVNNMRKSDLTKDLRCMPFWYSEIADKFDGGMSKAHADEVKSAIAFLKKKHRKVYKLWVADLMGVSIDLRKRRDLRSLFKREGRFHIVA